MGWDLISLRGKEPPCHPQTSPPGGPPERPAARRIGCVALRDLSAPVLPPENTNHLAPAMPRLLTFHQCLTFNEMEKQSGDRGKLGELKNLYDFQHMLKIMHELHIA